MPGIYQHTYLKSHSHRLTLPKEKNKFDLQYTDKNEFKAKMKYWSKSDEANAWHLPGMSCDRSS